MSYRIPCSECDYKISLGEKYYKRDGKIFCEGCAEFDADREWYELSFENRLNLLGFECCFNENPWEE